MEHLKESCEGRNCMTNLFWIAINRKVQGPSFKPWKAPSASRHVLLNLLWVKRAECWDTFREVREREGANLWFLREKRDSDASLDFTLIWSNLTRAVSRVRLDDNVSVKVVARSWEDIVRYGLFFWNNKIIIEFNLKLPCDKEIKRKSASEASIQIHSKAPLSDMNLQTRRDLEATKRQGYPPLTWPQSIFLFASTSVSLFEYKYRKPYMRSNASITAGTMWDVTWEFSSI